MRKRHVINTIDNTIIIIIIISIIWQASFGRVLGAAPIPRSSCVMKDFPLIIIMIIIYNNNLVIIK